MASTTEADGLGRAGVIMASGTIVSRLLGFLGAILLARTLGTVGSGADAFALANQLPNNIYALIAGGVLTAVLVPQIVRANADPDGGAAFINKIVTVGFIIFISLAALATILAPLLVLLYAQQGGGGGRGFSAEDIALATALAYWCLPQVLFYALYSLFGEVLNARKVFGPFTWAPVVNNIVFITGLVVFGALFGPRDTSDALQWTPGMVSLLGGAATAGIAVQALILLVFWRRAGIRYRPDFRWRGVGLAATGKAAGWLFGMILVAQIAGVVQANVATLATSDGEAGLAVLRFSWLLFMVPHSVITVSLATAYFTRMSAHASENSTAALRADVNTSIRRIGVMITLASAGLVALSIPFARLFGGQANQVEAMAAVLSAYAFGLIPFSLVFVIQRVYYSMSDTRTPFMFQLVHAVVFIAVALVASAQPSERIAVTLALGASLASLVQFVTALILLRNRLGGVGVGKILLGLISAIGAAIPAVGAGLLMVSWWGGGEADGFVRESTLGALVGIGGGGLVVTAVYLALMLLTKNRDAVAVVQGGLRLVRRVLTSRS
jgi:putative peptidoglycan lipid II flippase